MGGGEIMKPIHGIHAKYGITYWAGRGTGDYVIQRPDGTIRETVNGDGAQQLQQEVERLQSLYKQ